MNIALDIDGILADADVAFRAMMRQAFKRPFPKHKVKSFHYEDSFSLSAREVEKLYGMFLNEKLWLDIKPLKGAVECVKELGKDHRIIIVTARPREIKSVTVKWLKKHKIFYEKIYFTLADKHLISENHREKVDIFLEDHPLYVQRIASAGIRVIMFEYPWNKNTVKKPNIYRVKNWRQAMSKVSQISKLSRAASK